MDLFHWGNVSAPSYVPSLDPKKLTKFALGIWRTSIDARHAVLTEKYLAASGLVLPDGVDGNVLRFNARLKHGDGRSAGLVWLIRDVFTDEPTGILRVHLDGDGNVTGRRTLGRLFNSAIKLDADETVEQGLHLAGDIESGLRAMARGLRPTWAVTSTGAVEAFPAIPGIEAVTIIDGGAPMPP